MATAVGTVEHATPGPDARDARIDQKLLLWRAERACARSEPAQAHLARWPRTHHPDLWQGTVTDGVARGFQVALEEAISLAGAPTEDEDAFAIPADATILTGTALRRRRDLLLASSGARVRFSRKGGLVFAAGEGAVESANCLRFEAQRDCGDLDQFVPDASERARLFSAQFLPAQSFVEAPGLTQLRLAGRLGRKAIGWPCALTLSARSAEAGVRLRLELTMPAPGWRLRVRFLGMASAQIAHRCTDVRESVLGANGSFVAFTLVRACEVLRVDGEAIAVPAAARPGMLVHDFVLGA